MNGYLKVYLIIGYIINIIYQINCVNKYEDDWKKASLEECRKMQFDFLKVIVGGYWIMFFWLPMLITSLIDRR